MSGEDTTEPDVEFDIPMERGSAAQTEGLSADEALRLLDNQRRRTMLRHLMDHPDGPVPVDDLVGPVIASETPSPPGQHRNTERIKAGIHIQLPYLTNTDVIEYKDDTEQVHYQAHPRLEALLQCVDRLYQ